MSSKEALRVYIQHSGINYDFLHIEPRTNDNSIYFTIRAGPDTGKVRRLSFHPTGAVRHHSLATTRMQFFEPLSSITKVNYFLALTLDLAELYPLNNQRPDADFAVLPFSQMPRVIGFALAPLHSTADFTGLVLPCLGFAIWIFDAGPPSKDHIGGTWAHAPEQLFEEQVLNEEQAEIAYLRMLYGSEGTIVTPPNGENFLTYYLDVPMSRVPDVEIKGGRPGLKAQTHVSSETHKVKVRFSDKHGTLTGQKLATMDGSVAFNARLKMPNRGEN